MIITIPRHIVSHLLIPLPSHEVQCTLWRASYLSYQWNTCST